jgi:hypothetical protein
VSQLLPYRQQVARECVPDGFVDGVLRRTPVFAGDGGCEVAAGEATGGGGGWRAGASLVGAGADVTG